MRQAIINYVIGQTDSWVIGLIQDNEVKHRVSTPNYHEIGSIVSNWILNGVK